MSARLLLALALALLAALPVWAGSLVIAARIEQDATREARDRVDRAATELREALVREQSHLASEAEALAEQAARTSGEPELPVAAVGPRATLPAAAHRGSFVVREPSGELVVGAVPRLDRLALATLVERCALLAPRGEEALSERVLACARRAGAEGVAVTTRSLLEFVHAPSLDGFPGVARLVVAPSSVGEEGQERRVVLRLRDVRGALVAHVVVQAEADVGHAAADTVRTAATPLAVGVGALGLLLGLWLGGRLERPLRELEVAAGRIGRGDLDVSLVSVGAVGASETFSAFNRMARDLQEAQARARRAERVAAWRDIARRIAHEIKNPLTPIRMAMETLRRTKQRQHPDFDEIFDESTRTVLEEVERLERIVTEFSRFARLPRPQPVELDVREVASQVVQLHSLRADTTLPDGAARIPIALSAGELPKVRADRDQLTQVLVNLVQNALDAAASRRGERGHVEVALVASEEGVRIVVSDDGPGIPEADAGRVLEPYFTTKARGTGLGLAIAERIVSEHGGRLEVGRSARLGGAEIVVTLRREGPPDDPAASQTR